MEHEEFAKEVVRDLDAQNYMTVGQRAYEQGVREGLRRARWIIDSKARALTDKEKNNG